MRPAGFEPALPAKRGDANPRLKPRGQNDRLGLTWNKSLAFFTLYSFNHAPILFISYELLADMYAILVGAKISKFPIAPNERMTGEKG